MCFANKESEGKALLLCGSCVFFPEVPFFGDENGYFFVGQLKELGKHLKCIPKMQKAGTK